jgi:hypothetical protein
MSFSVTIPVANIAAANAALQAAGWGPGNFTVPVWTSGAMPVVAALHHIGNDVAFRAACVALAGATVRDYGQLAVGMDATATAAGGRWGGNAPLLQGQVTPGLYRAVPADGGGLWTVIQAFDRAVFTNPLADIPALVRKAKVPGLIEPWVQPIDQFDAYWTKNAFTGQPDRVTHNGRIWRSVVAEATPNVWAPGTAGIWADEGPAP